MSDEVYTTEGLRQIVAEQMGWPSPEEGLDAFDRWLAVERARVWDEGYAARPGVVIEETEFGPMYSAESPNPYKEDA